MHGIDLCLIALACWLAWELGARVLAVWRRVRRYRALMQKRRIRQIARTRSESSLAGVTYADSGEYIAVQNPADAIQLQALRHGLEQTSFEAQTQVEFTTFIRKDVP